MRETTWLIIKLCHVFTASSMISCDWSEEHFSVETGLKRHLAPDKLPAVNKPSLTDVIIFIELYSALKRVSDLHVV